MMKLTLPGPGCTVTIEGNNNKELIEQAQFWASLPSHCPICGLTLRLTHKIPDGKNHYHGLECLNPNEKHETSFGKRQDADETLYYKGEQPYKNPTNPKAVPYWPWAHYDAARNERVGKAPGSGMGMAAPKPERVGESPTEPDLDPDVQYDELGWPTNELIGNDQFLRTVVDKAKQGNVHYHQVVRYAKEKHDKDLPMDTHYLIGTTEKMLNWLGSVVIKLGSSG